MVFQLERKDIYIALFVAAIGFVFSTRSFISYLNEQTPFFGLVVYYVILFVVFTVLSKMGLAISSIKIDTAAKTLGLLLVTFAFFITIDWESCYINQVTNGECASVSNIYFASEDGATYYLWSQIYPNMETARFLTYIVTPFVLTLLGASLVRGRLIFSHI